MLIQKDLIKTLFERKDFEFVFDALNGISGPYALDIFNKIFKVPLENLDKCHPLPDFGGIQGGLSPLPSTRIRLSCRVSRMRL